MMYKAEKRKTQYVHDMETYNKLSDRVKTERGAFFSKLTLKADKKGDWDEIEYVLSHVYCGTGCRSNGDLDKMSEAALLALCKYDSDLDEEEVYEILSI